LSGKVQLIFEPSSGRFDALDDRWLSQVTGLVSELRREVGDVSASGTPVGGKKGALGSIVLSLASAGSLTTAVELVKAWLARDRTRLVKVSWSADGRLQEVELGGSGVDDAAFDQLVRVVTEQVAEHG
jgi:hypothetical protein